MEDRVKKLVERMEQERGFARPWHVKLAYLDPAYMELYHQRVTHVYYHTKALPRKITEIMGVCGNAAEFYEGGFRTHLRQALKAGATMEEILEALEVCTLVGMRGRFSTLIPAYIEEAISYGETAKAEQSIKKMKLVAQKQVDQNRNDVEGWKNILADRDSEFMRIYQDTFKYVFEDRKALARKFKEIIAAYITAVQSLSEECFKFHVHQALKAGASEEEILEMIKLVASRGIHTLSRLLEPLQEEVENAKKINGVDSKIN